MILTIVLMSLQHSQSKWYLIETQKDSPDNEGSDYQDNSKCSVKGLISQADVLGCGGRGRIELRCSGGCIEITKALYSCREKDEVLPKQKSIVERQCNTREFCTVTASRKIFGNEICPEKSENEMSLWIVFRCNGVNVTGRAIPRGRKRCLQTNIINRTSTTTESSITPLTTVATKQTTKRRTTTKEATTTTQGMTTNPSATTKVSRSTVSMKMEIITESSTTSKQTTTIRTTTGRTFGPDE